MVTALTVLTWVVAVLAILFGIYRSVSAFNSGQAGAGVLWLLSIPLIVALALVVGYFVLAALILVGMVWLVILFVNWFF